MSPGPGVRGPSAVSAAPVFDRAIERSPPHPRHREVTPTDACLGKHSDIAGDPRGPQGRCSVESLFGKVEAAVGKGSRLTLNSQKSPLTATRPDRPPVTRWRRPPQQHLLTILADRFSTMLPESFREPHDNRALTP